MAEALPHPAATAGGPAVTAHRFERIPDEAVGLKLFRIAGERLIACEPIRLARGRPAVICVLLRAEICGRVEVEGQIGDHFADILDDNQDIVATVALDAGSYRQLKERQLRCRLEPS